MHTRRLCWLALAGLLEFASGPAGAATFSGGAGADYQTGPEKQSYRGALLFASAEGAPGDLTIAAIRFNDSRVGPGVGAFANAGFGLASQLKLRAIVLRSVGDTDYHAWRWRAGPELRLASELTLGAYYLRIEEVGGSSFGSAGFEVTVPVLPNMAGQVGSSYGKWNGGAAAAQVAIAGTWRAAAHVQLLSEIDVGRNVITTSTTSHSGGGPLGGLPIVNGVGKGGSRKTEPRSDSSLTAAGQIGIRFLVP